MAGYGTRVNVRAQLEAQHHALAADGTVVTIKQYRDYWAGVPLAWLVVSANGRYVRRERYRGPARQAVLEKDWTQMLADVREAGEIDENTARDRITANRANAA